MNHHRKTKPFEVPADPGWLGYLAATFDSEGNFNSSHRPRVDGTAGPLYYQLCIGTSDPTLSGWLLGLGGSAYIQKAETNPLQKKDLWRWRLMAQADVLAFLKATLPFLMCKRTKALEVIEELEAKLERRGKGGYMSDRAYFTFKKVA